MSKKSSSIIIVESTIIVLLVIGIIYTIIYYKKNIVSVKEKPAVKMGKGSGHSPVMGHNSANKKVAGAVPVEVAKTVKKRMYIYISANCNIEAEKEIDILSKTNGEINEIYVEEGMDVQAGKLLVHLDKKEAKLEVKDAKVKLENTKILYERSKSTFDDKIVSREVLEEHKLNYQMAEVEYERKKLELDYYMIESPIQGTIVERYVEVGENVTDGQALFKIAKLDKIYGKVYVPEKDLNKIDNGQSVYISVESIPDVRFEGNVKLINPVIDPKSGTIKVTIEIDDKNSRMLRPGMFATVFILVGEHEDAIVIPKKSLIMDSVSDEVFVLKKTVKISFSRNEDNKISVGQGVEISVRALTKEGTSEDLLEKIVGGTVMDVKVVKIHSDAKGTEEMVEAVIDLTELPYYDIDKTTADIRVIDNGDGAGFTLLNVVLDEETSVLKKQIELGFAEGGDVEAVSGLDENDVVVVTGHEDLMQGSRVFVVGD